MPARASPRPRVSPCSDLSSLLRVSDGQETASPALHVAVRPDDHTPSFWAPVLAADAGAQRHAVASICLLLKRALTAPPHSLLVAHLPTVVRMAHESPFESVRTALQEFLTEIQSVRLLKAFDSM